MGSIGCGGAVSAEDPIPLEGGVAPDGSVDGSLPDGTLPDGGRPDARRDGGFDARRDTREAPDTWIEPECPDAKAPPPDYECDPLATPPGKCRAGEACYPYVIYPTEPCEHEQYASRCFPAGKGKQGDPCGEGDSLCAAGFACVASGAGNQCVKMCKPGSPGVCSEGLVCQPTDVPGVGGCL